MSKLDTFQTPQTATASLTVAPSGILQRKCAACGTHTVAGDKCESCRKNQEKFSGRVDISGVEDETFQSSNQSAFERDFSGIGLSGSAPQRIQTKLTVNERGDKYEQEADRIADAVMTAADGTKQKSPVAVNSVQATQLSRECSDDDDEKCSSRTSEDEFLQKKEYSNHSAKLNSNTESRIQMMRGQGQPLSAPARAFFEPRFGYDFSHVRVHTGGEATSAASGVNARAFTIGRDIVFGANEYAPETMSGKKLLAHELTHVLQQRNAVNSAAAFRIQRDNPKDKPVEKKDEPQKESPKKGKKAQLYPKTEEKAKEIVERLKTLRIDVEEPVKAKNVWIVNYWVLNGKQAKEEAEKLRKGDAGLEAGSDYDSETGTHYPKLFLDCGGVPGKKGYYIWHECFTKGDAKKHAEAKKNKLIEGYGAAELYERKEATGYAIYYKQITSDDLTAQQTAATKQLDSEKGQAKLKDCPKGYEDIGNFNVTTYNLALEAEASDKDIKENPCGLQGKFRAQFLKRVTMEGSGVSRSGHIIHVQSGKAGCYYIAPCAETASQTCAAIGRTVAVDSSVIPLGSELFIEGVGHRVAEDTGGNIKGKDIDVYRGLLTHDQAKKLTMPGKPKVCKKKK
jgi:3D (Asp-Asp-Asp) domain-containing protein